MPFTVVQQHDERDCGAACLAMVARHYGTRHPISKFREWTKTDQRGANLYGLVTGADMVDMDAEGLSGTIEDLVAGIESGRVSMPFIANIRENGMLHYAVVYGFRKNVLLVADPARGRRKLTLDQLEDLWTGHIVVLQKRASFKRENHARNNVSFLVSMLRGQYLKLLAVLLISLAIAAIGVMGAFAFQLVIDNLSNSAGGSGSESLTGGLAAVVDEIANYTTTDVLAVVFLALILLYLFQTVIQVARGFLIISVSKQIDVRLLLSYFNHLLDLPVSSVNLRKTGEYLARFSDAGAVRTAISGAAISLILDSTMLVGGGVLLYWQSPPLFWVSLSIVISYLIVLLGYRSPMERRNRSVMESNAVLQSFLKESIDGAETIKAAVAAPQVKVEARRRLMRFVTTVVRAGRLEVTQEALADAVQTVGTVVVLWLGFVMVSNGSISVGALITFYALLGFFVQPVRNLVELQPAIQTALIAVDRLKDVLDLEAEQAAVAAREMAKVSSWELREVDFRYGNRDLALRDVSMKIARGERVAIVGSSGSGKTTLAKLLLRFYEPEAGQILADGVALSSLDLAALRGAIAYVDQNTFLFADSISSNLRLGNPDATDDEIREACRSSRADDFIAGLPLGYETPLDENGMNLSGGQRQRLAIARALLKKPQLLILDEATSNLDSITEAGIKEAVAGLSRGITVIFIVHRLTTARDCDRIYVMSDGEVIERGQHDELLARQGSYASLWEMQALQGAVEVEGATPV